ncbi:aspartyl-phosphate phosphatase Spo0E family protein [Bacillus sp. AK031]
MHRQIEETRDKLFETAARYGLGNEKTIKVSQELDILLNNKQRKQLKKRPFSC